MYVHFTPFETANLPLPARAIFLGIALACLWYRDSLVFGRYFLSLRAFFQQENVAVAI